MKNLQTFENVFNSIGETKRYIIVANEEVIDTKLYQIEAENEESAIRQVVAQCDETLLGLGDDNLTAITVPIDRLPHYGLHLIVEECRWQA